jgi:hypothetical protein
MNEEFLRKKCCRCGAVRAQLYDNHSDCDAYARKDGWYVDGFQDLCPACVEARSDGPMPCVPCDGSGYVEGHVDGAGGGPGFDTCEVCGGTGLEPEDLEDLEFGDLEIGDTFQYRDFPVDRVFFKDERTVKTVDEDGVETEWTAHRTLCESDCVLVSRGGK